jgi:hypothetical protein
VRAIPPRLLSSLGLACAALTLAVIGAVGGRDDRLSNALFFVAWGVAVLGLFALALRLPMRAGGPRYRAALRNVLLAAAAILVTGLADVAVFRHDVHFDLSREAANTPPPQLQTVVEGLKTDISLTYFYNSADEYALKAAELLTIAARQNGHFQVRAVDLDKEPATARRFGVRAYNTAVLATEDRRVVVENSVDLGQMAYAALRVLKQQVDVLCFVTGHGEAFSPAAAHVHYSHVETLKGHEIPGSGDVLVGDPDGLDRLQLAVTTLGYATRAVTPATVTAIPTDCIVVVDIGPRRPYAPGEASVLSDYLARGGRFLLMIDPAFPVGRELAGLLGRAGLAAEPGVVIDPLNHYGSDDSKVAVPYYPPHPITNRVALTVFPEARPLRLGRVPDSVVASVLVSSSSDSVVRPLLQDEAGGRLTASTSAETRATRPSPAVLAVALEGRWPDAPAGQEQRFRFVLVGNSNFATNAYFPYVSNGDLAIGMVRWLAGDEALPAVKPQALSLEQIDLTGRQMRDIFVTVELLLPLSIVLLGGIVWWRRR